MTIKVTELCLVESENFDETTGLRTVVYNSPKDTLLEAFSDYNENFDSDNIISSDDDFEGGCLDTIKYLSVEEVVE